MYFEENKLKTKSMNQHTNGKFKGCFISILRELNKRRNSLINIAFKCDR